MPDYVPLSQRSALELRNQAEEFRALAATARTLQAKQGLEMLAVRFANLADRREAQERRSRPLRSGPTIPEPNA